ncbi:MAG: tRNA (guanosine(46)-N7)-methyltransferase TrmB [Chitinophagales bacterium]|nr:tRNA (guanosine(46)-N7)-methyltransferase TrmB [Chitinophagales bacterium]
MKNKLFKYAAINEMHHVLDKNPHYKNAWQTNFFKNNNPIVVELACGKGDYALAMAQLFPNKNFIGVDIKGNRIYTAARKAEDEKIQNVAFIRDQIDLLTNYFEKDEIDEIWITFADPFPKKSKHKKRLTSKKFLKVYQQFLKKDGIIHLKTDSDILYEYTKEVLQTVPSKILKDYPDVYAMNKNEELYNIQTHYEKMHLKDGRTIKYIAFQIQTSNNSMTID